jgi:fumarate reductase subunit C
MSRQPYVRPISKTTWYMRNGRYKRYMLREVTCLLVGLYSFLAIWALAALAAGPNQWNAFLKTQQSPGLAGVHALMLIYFLVFMTFDWFKLAPKAMAVQVGGKKLPDRVIVIAHYAAWAVVSLFVFWLAGVL